MQWLKHAFAVDPPNAAQPDETQQRAADAVCREIVRRHLTTPALVFLESMRPLNYVIAHGLHFAMPFVSVLTRAEGPRRFATFLEHRGSFEYLCRRIEELEADALSRERQGTAFSETGAASGAAEAGAEGDSSPSDHDIVRCDPGVDPTETPR